MKLIHFGNYFDITEEIVINVFNFTGISTLYSVRIYKSENVVICICEIISSVEVLKLRKFYGLYIVLSSANVHV
jgi:hypothetical protein